jgi:RimJ/RimL family protein N-acetyltransferase
MLRHPDQPLSDGVITLRKKTRHDIDALVAICQDPAISQWTRVPNPYTREDAEGWIAAAELDLQVGRAIDWLAVDGEDQVVASIAVQDIRSDEGIGEIGYWVAAAARGRGIATRAVRLAGGFALRDLGLSTLEILTHEDNLASQGVARAAGFTETGETDVPPREGLAPGRYLVFTTPGGPRSACRASRPGPGSGAGRRCGARRSPGR